MPCPSCSPGPQSPATVVLLHHGVETGSWPLHWRGRPTIATVDLVARTRLGARRFGRDIRLRAVSPELAELLKLAGLAELLGVEVVRQPEEVE